MAFKRYQGKPSVEYFDVGDTTAKFSDGGVVQKNTSGQLANLGNDSDDVILGVIRKDVATSDSANEVPVQMAEESVVWKVETDSDGGASSTDVGRYCAVDTGDTDDVNATVDVDDSTVPHFLITGVVSSTEVLGRFARTSLRKPATHGLDS